MRASIIIPSYNRGEKLIQTIESIENNTLDKKEFEIIIIDDFSTDNTQEIIKNLIKKYPDIKTAKNKKNSGPAISRNNGIKLAKGNFIFFTDDDCLVPTNWINTYLSFLKEHTEVYCAGGILEAKDKNFISWLENFKDKLLGIAYKKEIVIGNQEVKTGFTNNCVYKKEVFKKIGYFKENFKVPAGEDLEFSQRVAKKYKIAFVPIVVLHNHQYDLNYLLGLIYKQGLGQMPPKKYKLLKLIIKFPKLILNVIKKIFSYRK